MHRARPPARSARPRRSTAPQLLHPPSHPATVGLTGHLRVAGADRMAWRSRRWRGLRGHVGAGSAHSSLLISPPRGDFPGVGVRGRPRSSRCQPCTGGRVWGRNVPHALGKESTRAARCTLAHPAKRPPRARILSPFPTVPKVSVCARTRDPHTFPAHQHPASSLMLPALNPGKGVYTLVFFNTPCRGGPQGNYWKCQGSA